MKRLAIVAVGLGAIAAMPASAQVMALNPTTMIGFAGTGAADRYARRDFGKQFAARNTQRRPNPTASVRPAQFAYRPSTTVRRQVYDRAIAQAQKTSPSEAAKLKGLLFSGKVTRDTVGYLARYGMSATNVADTTTLYLALAWVVAHGTPNDPSRAQMLGLRNQVAATFAANPGFARASDATKQDLSEANIIQAAYVANIGNAMEKNPKFAATARPAAAKGVMALYGINLFKMNLTSQGLR